MSGSRITALSVAGYDAYCDPQTGEAQLIMLPGNTEIAPEAIGTVTIGGQERPRNFVVKTIPPSKRGKTTRSRSISNIKEPIMKRHILYLAMLALGTAATGCSDDDTAKEGRTEPTTVESISIRTQMAEVSRAQTGDDDPTMGPASTRAGHTMTVTLGSGSERMQATYEYDGGKWIPAGEAVVFPDNKRQPVRIILRKEGTIIQDGTAPGTYRRRPAGVGQPRPGTAAGDGQRPDAAPEDHGGIRTGHDRRHGAHGRRPQSLPCRERQQMAGDHRAVDTRVQGFGHGQQHRQHDGGQRGGIPDGVFLADYRYTVPLVLNGSELTLGTIGVGSWDEGAGGTAQGMTPTHYRIEGLENRTIEVYLAGSDSPTQITLDAKGEAMQQAGVPGRHRRQDRLRRRGIRDRARGKQ